MERSVRVCLFSDSFYPAYGGGTMRFRRYLPGFRARGLEVEVFSGTPSRLKARMAGVEPMWEEHPVGARLPSEHLDGTPVHRVRLPEGPGWRRGVILIRALLEHCRARRQPPDVVQFLSLSLPSLPWVSALRRMGVRMVLTKTMVVEPPDSGWRGMLLRWRHRLPAEAVDCVVASTSVMRAALRDLGIGSRIVVIGNGVDLERFRPPDPSGEDGTIRRSLGIEAGAPLALFVGGVSPRKGVDLLLEAWCHLGESAPAAHLVIVGPRKDRLNPSDAAFHARLTRLRQASAAPDRIHFVGYRENVADYMRAADVFVFASHREGMGNVVLEAMACGLPVVTTPFVGLPREFGVPGTHYVLSERNASTLAAAISELLADDERRESIGRAARARVEAEHDVRLSLDRYASLYEELGDGGHRTA